MTLVNQIGVGAVTVLLLAVAVLIFTSLMRKTARESGAQVVVVFIGLVLITSLLVWAAVNGHSPYPAFIH